MTEAILFALMAVALLAVGAFFLRQGRSGFNSEFSGLWRLPIR